MQWDRNYAAYFDKIKNCLPKTFIKYYYDNGGFHDFIISDIHIQNQRPDNITIEILLDSNYTRLGEIYHKFLMTYRGVKNYNIFIPEDKRWSFGNLQWLVSEFRLREDGLWGHRIMCDGNCEMRFVFKRIGIKKLTKSS